MVEERRRAMLAVLDRDGRLRAVSLAEQFGVSVDSIRRDLRDLDHRGLVQRVRGGAVRRLPTAGQRLQAVTDGQLAVARALAERVQLCGGVVVLDNGSTAALVAQHLTGRDGLTVVTGNPAAAFEAWANQVQVVLLGGVVDVPLGGVVDASAVDALGAVRADIAVLGVCAVDEGGVTTDVPSEVAFKRAVVASAGEVWIATTDDKLGTGGTYVVAGRDDIDVLATDAPDAAVAALGLHDDVTVIRVDP
jgi:DeoR/GlpR family transcriptional regulator of sugar metabolism